MVDSSRSPSGGDVSFSFLRRVARLFNMALNRESHSGSAAATSAFELGADGGESSAGWRDANLIEPFDAEYYLRRYPDVAADGGDPYAHFIMFGRAEGRAGVPPMVENLEGGDHDHLGQLEQQGERSEASVEPFDAEYYLKRYPDVAADGGDPYAHFIMFGRAEGRAGVPPVIEYPEYDHLDQLEQQGERNEASAEQFDEEYYLKRYPDVAATGVDPYRHFIAHGKAEGRRGVPLRFDYSGDFEQLDPQRETVLIVSHEASRTGAPVLSLNLVMELKKKYNIVTLLLGGGSLLEDFQRSSNIVIGPLHDERDSGAIGSLIAQLLELVALSFAVVNSIQSRCVLRGLGENFVPAITLIHEFSAYTRPVEAFEEAALWSSEMIFSAPVIYRDAVAACPDIANFEVHVLPQGRCMTPSPASAVEYLDREAIRITRALWPEDLSEDTFVVLGVGSVQLRKGVDLFIDCAARVLRHNRAGLFRFVWVGGGFDPENDMDYSVYLADQVRRAGLEDHVYFAGETKSIEAAYAAADMMLISSRLDPLPNVAIDAMAHGLPLVCFDQTTGIADILNSHGLGEECVVPYLDTAAMAEKTLQLMRSKALRQRVADRGRELVQEVFDMPRYVHQIEVLGLAARERADAEGGMYMKRRGECSSL